MQKTVFAPGRTELAGNHTDHQNGRILAAAVSFGLSAECEENDSQIINIKSEGHGDVSINIGNLKPNAEEFGSSKGLVRGVVASFREFGLKIGGFNASVKSDLPAGLGLSSSAAYSVLIGKILNELFNGGTISPVVIARSAKSAENNFFGKPCGLMDQLASAMGQCIYVDFSSNEIQLIKADFSQMGLQMCLTNTGGSHAGLDTSYARIPADMIRIANMLDKGVLGEVDPELFWSKGWNKEDRPVRRAMHFFGENERVPKMKDALLAGNGEEYMKLMNESGRSSEELLNNIITSATGDTRLAEGLELSKKILDGRGAWRVHGGGFAGCVQALMPVACFEEYRQKMEREFGEGSCIKINII